MSWKSYFHRKTHRKRKSTNKREKELFSVISVCQLPTNKVNCKVSLYTFFIYFHTVEKKVKNWLCTQFLKFFASPLFWRVPTSEAPWELNVCRLLAGLPWPPPSRYEYVDGAAGASGKENFLIFFYRQEIDCHDGKIDFIQEENGKFFCELSF